MNNDPAETRRRLDVSINTLSRWLNEDWAGPVDRHALAQVLAHVKYPPEWIPLTEQEIGELYRAGFSNNTDFARAVEARLKVKNDRPATN